MAHGTGHTGSVVGDLFLLSIGWAGPHLLNISLTDVSDIVIPIAQTGTTILVLATAWLRYKKSKKDNEENGD